MIKVRQIDRKQLYVVGSNIEDIHIYYSYETPIAIAYSSILLITKEYFSNTTSHHKGTIIRERPYAKVIELEQHELEDLVEKTIPLKKTFLEAILRSQGR